MMLNGQLPDDALVSLGTDGNGRPIRLQPDAAASLERVSRASGIPLGPSSIEDSYRDLDRQKKYEKNPPNGKGLAAKAGKSTHGWGLAIDAAGSLLLWLLSRGAEYGWVRTIPAELWHFEYQVDKDRHRGEDEDMDANQAKQLADTRTEVANIQRVVAKLDALLPALTAHLNGAPGTPAGTYTIEIKKA